MRFRTVALAGLAIVLTAAPPSKAGDTSSTLDKTRLQLIRPRLEELVEKGNVAGVVALVAQHGKVECSEAVGFANIEEKRRMRSDSIFQIMSMTKNFTGVGIMMLVDDGKLELRRPVEDYLSEFQGIQIRENLPNGSTELHAPRKPPMVWQLMSHTSGLAGDPDGELADNPRTLRVSLAEAVKFYGHEQLQFEPGTRWRYSNMGIAALGRIIEVVSGQDYVTFMKTRLLDPLGLKDTFFFPPADKRDRIALVYKHVDGKLVRSGDEVLAGDPARYRAGAKYPAPEFGLYSTAPDLLRFYQMLLNGGTYEGRRYLSRQSIDTMTRVFTPEVEPAGHLGGTSYGLTFEIITKATGTLLLHSPGTFGHGGAFGTEGWIDPANDLIRIELEQLSDGTGGAARAVVMQVAEAAVVR